MRRDRPRLHGHDVGLHERAARGRPLRRRDPPGARARHGPDRHGRHVRPVHERGGRRPRAGRPPRGGRARDEGGPGRRGPRDVHAPARRLARPRARGHRRLAAAPRHRSRRPVPAAPRRRARAGGGDLGRDGRGGGRRQGAGHRPLRGHGGRARARARDPPGRLGAVRAVAVDARPARRRAPLVPSARCRLHPVRAARPRLPDRHDHRGVVRRRRLPRAQPALHPRGARREPGDRGPGAVGRRASRGDPGAGRARLGARPGRPRRPDPRDDPARAGGGERAGRDARARTAGPRGARHGPAGGGRRATEPGSAGAGMVAP